MSEPTPPEPLLLPRDLVEAVHRILGRALGEIDDTDMTEADIDQAMAQAQPVSLYEPPPPGSTRDKLPDDILALLAPRIYLSTACEMALACEMAAKVRHPERGRDLRYWAWWLHVKKCRLNNKYSNRPCSCACHDTTKEGP